MKHTSVTAGRRTWRRISAGMLTLLLVAATLTWRMSVSDPDAGMTPRAVPDPADATLVERGRYLAIAGNCAGCHTERGGEQFAGGRAIPTPFGTLHGPNITPDPEHGIGGWSADDFWRALHLGVAPDGRPLYPAFPYPSYTRVRRDDADALFAYLRSLTPVAKPSRKHSMRFPFDQRPLLHVWRALYFRAGVQQDDPSRDAGWNRGAYLVQGLGHCAACHTERNLLGGQRSGANLAGAVIPALQWYAPPLHGPAAGAGASWSAEDLAAVMHSGVSSRGAVTGPMAEVVARSLQYLTRSDIDAIGRFLASLPDATPPRPARQVAATAASLAHGAELYDEHCAECHRSDGRGAAPAFPPLAGNPGVTAPVATNTIRIMLHGGFPPATVGNPRPHGMPPFSQSLTDTQLAAIASFVRGAWGNGAGAVSAADVAAQRSPPID